MTPRKPKRPLGRLSRHILTDDDRELAIALRKVFGQSVRGPIDWGDAAEAIRDALIGKYEFIEYRVARWWHARLRQAIETIPEDKTLFHEERRAQRRKPRR